MNFDFAVAGGYFAGWRIVRALPEKFAYKTFDRIGQYALSRNGSRVKRLRSNLSRVCPEKSSSEMEDLMRLAMRSYLRYWCDTFRFPNWDKDRINSTVTVTRENLLLDAIKSGKGVIVSLPHAGNWDHAGAYFCLKGIHLVTVAERLKPTGIYVVDSLNSPMIYF